MADRNKDEEHKQAPLHGDLLETILSFVPLIHLISASQVSSAWRRAALSLPSRAKPWLVLQVESRRRKDPSLTTARAYDPTSHEWIHLSRASSASAREPPPPPQADRLRCSHSTLLYRLTASTLSFTTNSITDTWHSLEGPYVWRTDPIVALVGSHVVVAGGSCDFEDDPMAVEVYDLKDGRRWDTCQSMPSVFRDCASATWLSVAVSETMYLMEKNSGRLCSFDPKRKRWEVMGYVRPEPSISFSVIGCSGDRLVLVGIIGDGEDVGVWEVMMNCASLECVEIGRMPVEMVRRLRDCCCSDYDDRQQPMRIGIVMERGFVYVYDERSPRNVFFCEFDDGGVCEWGSVKNCDLVLNDESRMERLLFTCVRVGVDDLRKSFGSGKWSFSMIKDGK